MERMKIEEPKMKESHSCCCAVGAFSFFLLAHCCGNRSLFGGRSALMRGDSPEILFSASLLCPIPGYMVVVSKFIFVIQL